MCVCVCVCVSVSFCVCVCVFVLYYGCVMMSLLHFCVIEAVPQITGVCGCFIVLTFNFSVFVFCFVVNL